ncbi:MAG: hypothetical protein ACREDO_11845 [Methyloceanibacter sp.]
MARTKLRWNTDSLASSGGPISMSWHCLVRGEGEAEAVGDEEVHETA